MKQVLLGGVVLLVLGQTALTAATIELDVNTTVGGFPTAWGANIGPIPSGAPTNPAVTAGYHDIGVRFIRTHDYYGPLDMRLMYPDQGADPALASSYDFTASDAVWRAILTNGFLPYFRLGNSYATTGPYAPTNQANWIEAAVRVIRHYADPSLWGTNALRSVEIWNEPNYEKFWEQYPGSRLRFFEFFTAVANRLRAEFPDLKIGGPAITQAAFMAPASTNYVPQFLDYLRSNSVSLDFFSWHVYGNDPSLWVQGARFYRACLDAHGFTHTEQHVTEYNTDNHGTDDVAVRAWLPGAAINAAAWMAMQQENIALATIYRGPDPDLGAPFFYGIFYADAQPKAVALAAKLCNTLAAFSNRLEVASDATNLWAMAARRNNEVALLLSNPTTTALAWTLDLADGRVPQNPTVIDIVATATNAVWTNVISWALRTNALAAGPQTLAPWGVQLVTFGVLSDYDHWAQTLYGLVGSDATPEADPDGDGAPNQAEFVAGTNPTNALSRFCIESVSAASGHVTLHWMAVPGRTYRVQGAPGLKSAGLWSELSSDLSSGTFTDTNSAAAQFYRVRIVP